MNLTREIFTNPAATAALAVVLAWLLAQAARRWLELPPIPVALFVAGVIYLLGRYADEETQALVLDLLAILFATLAAAGVNVVVNKARTLIRPDRETAGVAGAQGEGAGDFWEVW